MAKQDGMGELRVVFGISSYTVSLLYDTTVQMMYYAQPLHTAPNIRRWAEREHDEMFQVPTFPNESPLGSILLTHRLYRNTLTLKRSQKQIYFTVVEFTLFQNQGQTDPYENDFTFSRSTQTMCVELAMKPLPLLSLVMVRVLLLL